MSTIASVAALAGVGVGTVSRVLNDSTAVSGSTRMRVLEAIEALEYEPSAAARALSTGRTCTVGVLAPFFTEPSVVERLRGVTRRLESSGYQVTLFDVERPEQGDAAFASLAVKGRVDGLLVVSLPPTAAQLERLQAAGIPVVLIDRLAEDTPGVYTDDAAGGRLAAQHLLDLGHERTRSSAIRRTARSASPRARRAATATRPRCATPRSSRGPSSCAWARTGATPHAPRRASCSRSPCRRPRSSPPPTIRPSACSRRPRWRGSRCPGACR